MTDHVSRTGAVVATILLALAALAAPAATARAADGGDGNDRDAFTLDVRTYAWLAGTVGDIGARGLTAHVDQNFWDALAATDSLIGFFARIDARQGPVGGYVDAGYVRLGVEDVRTPLGKADFTADLTLVDFALTYRVLDKPRTDSAPGLTLFALAGGRYVHVGNDLDFDQSGSRNQSRDWIDPIVGAEAAVHLSDRWLLIVHGDIGGFGVNADLTWSAFALVGYRFKLGKWDAELLAGYKAVGEDFTDGSGSDRFTWDTILHGPVVALNIRF